MTDSIMRTADKVIAATYKRSKSSTCRTNQSDAPEQRLLASEAFSRWPTFF